MSSSPVLGRRERVELRQAWLSEATHFTPWLSQPENIALLGEAIGIELEVQGVEQYVGPFRADILCKELRTDTTVLIENQLERTDHAHLGQLLTYAAGLKAAIVIWVAAKFTDEHRAALDWLNEITPSQYGFFGLEVELWRIGGSAPAPKFNVVSQPNEWSKTSVPSGGSNEAASETRALHLEFWTQLQQYVEQKGSPVHIRPTTQNPISMSLGRGGFSLRVANLIGNQSSWIWLLISGPNAKAFYHAIKDRHGPEVEATLGTKVTWQEFPERPSSAISIGRSSNLKDRSTWPELTDWIAEKLEVMDRLFRPMIHTLDAAASDALDSGVPDDPVAELAPCDAPDRAGVALCEGRDAR